MKSSTKSKLISGVFIAFVFAMGVLYAVLPKSDFSETEKRYLAELPKFSIESLSNGDFTSDFEDYLSDHMPFRNFFVSLNSYFELAKGNNGSNGIYLGSDGWLIETPFDRDNRFDINIKRIAAFATRSDIPAALVAVPEKGSIYGDKLPKNALKYEDEEYFRKIQTSCGNNLTFINVYDAMISEKYDKQLYYKTDHHWTSDGAYICYREICSQLGIAFADENSFSCEITNGFYGTSYSKSLYTFTKPDSIKVMRSKKTGGVADITINDGKDTHSKNMFFTNALKKSDKYEVFLDGNHSLVKIKTGNEGGKLFVIKDSFAHCLVPFLAENYSEIVMVDLRYYKKPVSKLIETEAPDSILFVYGMDNLVNSSNLILR